MKKKRQFTFFLTAFMVLSLGSYFIAPHIFAINHITYSFDTRLSPQICATVEHYIREHALKKNLADLSADIKKQFPCIAQVALHVCAPSTLHCACTSVTPLALTQKGVLTYENRNCSCDSFQGQSLNHLPSIGVEESCPVSLPLLCTTVQQLLPIAHRTYAIAWMDNNKIVLQHKEKPHFAVVCSTVFLPTSSLLARCESIQQEHEAFEKKSGASRWVADIRFENQIVMQRTKRG